MENPSACEKVRMSFPSLQNWIGFGIEDCMKPFPPFDNYFASFNADSVIILWLSRCCYLVVELMQTLCNPYPTRLLSPWNSPGKNTGVGCHALLQGISPTQGLKPHLLNFHCQVGSLMLPPPGKSPMAIMIFKIQSISHKRQCKGTWCH